MEHNHFDGFGFAHFLAQCDGVGKAAGAIGRRHDGDARQATRRSGGSRVRRDQNYVSVRAAEARHQSLSLAAADRSVADVPHDQVGAQGGGRLTRFERIGLDDSRDAQQAPDVRRKQVAKQVIRGDDHRDSGPRGRPSVLAAPRLAPCTHSPLGSLSEGGGDSPHIRVERLPTHA